MIDANYLDYCNIIESLKLHNTKPESLDEDVWEAYISYYASLLLCKKLKTNEVQNIKTHLNNLGTIPHDKNNLIEAAKNYTVYHNTLVEFQSQFAVLINTYNLSPTLKTSSDTHSKSNDNTTNDDDNNDFPL